MNSLSLVTSSLVAVGLGATIATSDASARVPARVHARVAECTLQATWKHDFVAPDSRNYDHTRLTDGGKYRVSIKTPSEKPPTGRIHEWILHVEDTTGVAVDNATICIDGGMPEHGHGLPTNPALSGAPSGGDYRIEGMKFSMSGWWVVKFVIQAPAGADSVRFNLDLR